MASSDVRSGKSTRGYDIPKSIVSLPKRLQEKIQSETEFQLDITKKTEQNSVKNHRQVIGHQSPQRICNTRFVEKEIKVDSCTGLVPTSSSLTKERSQHSLKDSCTLSRRGENCVAIGSATITKFNSEPPSWFKNVETIGRNEYWRQKMQNLNSLHLKYYELIEKDDIFLKNWSSIMECRKSMKDIFTKILDYNLKFCCKENIEMYFWKILYYNLIERLRRNIQKLQQIQNSHQHQQQQQQILNEQGYDLKLKAFQLIQDGEEFYEEKFEYLENKYFEKNVSPLPNLTTKTTKTAILVSTSNNICQKYELLAKILMQKILIHLGDLSRYKEQIENGNNFISAKQYYQNAQKLIPSNGIPYNQLAILSIYYKKTFDAVYFYMRSLCASNPIHSAKESLKELFDEIRKRREDNLRQNNQQHFGRAINNDNELSYASNIKELNLPLKKEIWINKNGSRRLHRFGSINTKQQLYYFEEKTLLTSLNSDDLLKRFTSNYLHIIGKLFTSIGMENYMKILNEFLIEFKIIIFHKIMVLPKNRLLQIIALDIFVIEYNRQKELQQQIIHAFNTGSLIFGIILNRCNEILREVLCDTSSSSEDDESSMVLKLASSSPSSSATAKQIKEFPKSKYVKKELNYNEFPIELKSLLQAIKIWCDWLKKNLSYWNSSKFGISENYDNLLNDYEINPWNGLAQLITLLSCIHFKSDTNKKNEILNNFKLSEDIYFDGFSPLNLNSVDTSNDQNISDVGFDEKLEMIQRLECIKQFGLEVLCECEPPVFEKVFDATGAIVYIKRVIKESEIDSNDDALENFENFDDELDYLDETSSAGKLSPTPSPPQSLSSTTTTTTATAAITASSSSNKIVCDNDCENQSSNDDLSELIKRKQELEMQTKQHQEYQQKLKNLLKNSDTIFHIEVKPKYLIPDTNCFIDHLPLLETITNLNSKRFILTIPTVVCNELEGLSKGFKISNIKTLQATSSTIRHFDEVTIRAREALEFIKSKKYFNIKFVTTKGSILNTSNFIVEDDDDNGRSKLNGVAVDGSGLNGTISNDGGDGGGRNHSKNSNDDKILQSGLNLCNRTNIEKKLKGKIFIQTECVLLTTDRNLRVKALSRNLSVSQLKEFINWASIFEK